MLKVIAYPLEQRGSDVHGKCVKCGQTFAFDNMILNDVESCTTDCNNCGVLLLINNATVVDFHKHLHAGDSRWPEDGANTGFIEFRG